EDVKAIEKEYDRSEGLAALAPHLPESLLTQALETARAMEYESSRSVALAVLAPHLQESLWSEVLVQTLEAATAIQDEYSRSLALAALAPRLGTSEVSCLLPLWEQTLPILASRTRKDLLADLCSLLPIIVRLGGAQAVAETFRAIQDVGRWWP